MPNFPPHVFALLECRQHNLNKFELICKKFLWLRACVRYRLFTI